jgi:hypothetical protein
MKNGTKSPDDKKRKTKKRKEAKDHAPMAKAQLSEVKTVSEAKPVMRVQAAAPMPAPKPKPKPRPVAAAKKVKAAPAPKPAPVTKAPAKPALKSVPKLEPKIEAKSNGKAKKDVKAEGKTASKSATPEAAFEMAPLMLAFKPPLAMPSFAMPQAMMPPSLAKAGQDALAVNRKLVEMTQANMRSGLDFAMRLATVKTPMELVSLQMSYWQERMGAFARQAEELRALARGARR